jgi:hypothetical protein
MEGICCYFGSIMRCFIYHLFVRKRGGKWWACVKFWQRFWEFETSKQTLITVIPLHPVPHEAGLDFLLPVYCAPN